MARLFISFLGTGVYRPCNYTWQEGENTVKCRTRFIQEATLRMIDAEDWDATDRICIFLTDKAKGNNWLSHTNEGTSTAGLEEVIEKMQLKAQVKDIHVAEGKNEEELWEIFQTVFDQIGEGDKVYFDITHGFRYLPMLALVLMNYAKALKNISVEQISYGNFEARTKDETGDNAPITDLKSLSVLQDWTIAASDYKKYGNVTELKNLVDEKLIPLLRNPEEKPIWAMEVRKLVGLLEKYSVERQTCRGLDIVKGKTAQQIINGFKAIKGTGIVPLNPIFELLQGTIAPPEDTIRNCLHAARWCYERQLYQQAITILQEGVVAFLAERNGIDKANENERGLITGGITIKQYNTPEKEWRGDHDIIKKILSDSWVDNQDFRNVFNATSDIRNDFNHAGFRSKRTPLDAKKMSKSIRERISAFEKLLLPHDKKSYASENSTVYINLSNHPTTEWMEEQKAEAKRYGELVDVPFPSIPEDATGDEVELTANEVVNELLKDYKEADLTIHVMGEQVATYHIVRLLKEKGIRCVASSTRREAQDLGDGKKLSQFVFAGFRAY